jgi:hypothetical protein
MISRLLGCWPIAAKTFPKKEITKGGLYYIVIILEKGHHLMKYGRG